MQYFRFCAIIHLEVLLLRIDLSMSKGKGQYCILCTIIHWEVLLLRIDLFSEESLTFNHISLIEEMRTLI